jgi:hypothetical protein
MPVQYLRLGLTEVERLPFLKDDARPAGRWPGGRTADVRVLNQDQMPERKHTPADLN